MDIAACKLVTKYALWKYCWDLYSKGVALFSEARRKKARIWRHGIFSCSDTTHFEQCPDAILTSYSVAHPVLADAPNASKTRKFGAAAGITVSVPTLACSCFMSFIACGIKPHPSVFHSANSAIRLVHTAIDRKQNARKDSYTRCVRAPPQSKPLLSPSTPLVVRTPKSGKALPYASIPVH